MNSKGFSLIEVMVAGVIMSMISVAALHMNMQMHLNALGAKQSLDLSGLVATMYLATGAEKTCITSLGGQPYKVDGSQEITLTLPGTPPLKAGESFSGFRFASVRLDHIEPITAPLEHYARLVLEVGKLQRTPGAQDYIRTVKLKVTLDPDSKVLNCQSVGVP